MNPSIFPPATGKQRKMGSLILVWQLVLEEENSEFQTSFRPGERLAPLGYPPPPRYILPESHPNEQTRLRD